jgi:hypothetical protein
MILYAVAAEVSLGRLFLAGIGPGLLLVALFSVYAAFRFRKEFKAASRAFERDGTRSAYLDEKTYTLHEKVEMLPRVLPFVILLIGVMVALYGGYATPSETAGLGAVLAFVLIAVTTVFFGETITEFPRGVTVPGIPQGLTNPPVHSADVNERNQKLHAENRGILGVTPGTVVRVFIFLLAFVTYYFVNWRSEERRVGKECR